ncbi:MAG: hypothetical protein QOF28_1502, partial [Actinomycetota bacterium]|nr:hypothetical protein [Actinomycetota bacterium]
EPDAIRDAVVKLLDRDWERAALVDHASAFSEDRFAARLTNIVDEELAASS